MPGEFVIPNHCKITITAAVATAWLIVDSDSLSRCSIPFHFSFHRPLGEQCPLGFICDEKQEFMSNCSDIRQAAINQSFGDLLGGIYCPENKSTIENCPIGYYCPTPFEQIICPEGEYCPHKSAEPWIDCGRCDEGAVELERHMFGYAIFGVVISLIFFLIWASCLRVYRKDLVDRQVELLARQVNSLSFSIRQKDRQSQLERMKPKLEIISERLSKLESSSPDSTSRSSTGNNLIQLEDKLVFDARRVYDALDTDGDHELSYDELNVVLGLGDFELETFFERMQELSGTDPSKETVSRQCFVRYFLQVLEENSHFNVTSDEAAATYDGILEENGKGFVEEKMFYSSSISRFLSEQQIYSLIKVSASVWHCGRRKLWNNLSLL
jgi:hypothetical protein